VRDFGDVFAAGAPPPRLSEIDSPVARVRIFRIVG
jgi:hypothetical protein